MLWIERIIRRDTRQVNGRVARNARSWTRPVVLGVALTLLTVMGCSERRANKLYESARVHVENGEFDDAVTVLETIVNLYPDTEAAERAAAEITLYRGLSTAVTSYPQRHARDRIVTTARGLYNYRRRHGSWPKALDDLKPRFVDEEPIDPWGRPFLYRVRGRRYVLASLGSDGAAGGTEDAQDWYIEDGRFVSRPTLELR